MYPYNAPGNQFSDHRGINCRSPPWRPPALPIQLLGDLTRAPPLPTQLPDTPQQLLVVTHLLVTPHRPDEFVRARHPPKPVDRDVHVLTISPPCHDHPVDQVPGDRLTVGGRGRFRLPEVGNVGR